MVNSLHYALANTTDSNAIVRVNVVDKTCDKKEARIPREVDQLYQFFDEEYLSWVAKSMGWPRDRGVVELIPIVVGMGVID